MVTESLIFKKRFKLPETIIKNTFGLLTGTAK